MAIRCAVTENPVGTDTHPKGQPCECVPCRVMGGRASGLWHHVFIQADSEATTFDVYLDGNLFTEGLAE